jgi:hypothetical protein
MINNKFDGELTEEIRLCYGGMSFRGNRFEVVPEELTHRYLLDNFNVSSRIKKYYYLPCRDMFPNSDYEKFKSTGYFGNPETTLEPYPFSFDGAFIPRKQLYFRIQHLIHWPENYNNKPLKIFIDLFPYFEEYAKGFKVGFESFEEDCIKKFLPMFADKNDFISKTFEYVTKEVVFKHSWRNNHSGFTVSKSAKKFDAPGEIIKAFEDGKFQGYFYRAWSVILSNSALFDNLFQKTDADNTIKSSLTEDLLYAAHTMQQNKIFWKADEDTKTRQLLDLLPSKYQTKDQSKYGKSHIGKKSGSVDGVIKENNVEIFVEAFTLKSLNRSVIKIHIDKLESNYDSKGLKEKFIIVYYNLAVNKFESSIKKYVNYIEKEHSFIYPMTKEMEEVEINYTDSRLFESIHKREGKNVSLYHLLLKFPD